MNDIIKTKDLASALGISERRIQQLTKEDILPFEKRGYYSLRQSIQKYISYQLLLDRKKYKKNDTDINEARKRREFADAEIREMELQKLKGELIETSEVANNYSQRLVILKTRLLAISTNICRRLLKKTSIREVKLIIDTEVYKALNELSHKSITD